VRNPFSIVDERDQGKIREKSLRRKSNQPPAHYQARSASAQDNYEAEFDDPSNGNNVTGMKSNKKSVKIVNKL